MKKHVLALLGAIATVIPAWAQQTFPVNGISDNDHLPRVLVGATVHTSAKDSLVDAVVIIEEGRIKAVGVGLAIPKDAVVYNLKGRHIYPAFVELLGSYGVDVPKSERSRGGRGPQYDPTKPGAYTWNDALHPERNVGALFNPDQKKAEALRKAGFGAVLSHVEDGIQRGTGALTLLGPGSANENLLREKAATFWSFDKGTSGQSYPSSQMGSIALLRQTFIDADWYAKQPEAKRDRNLGLEAWNSTQSLPPIFITTDLQSMLRADRVGDEFKTQFILRGNGAEYQRINEVKATGAAIIVPLNFPKAFDVEDPYDALLVPYADLLHWEMAPANPSALEKAGIPFVFSANGLEKPSEIIGALRTAIRFGLSKEKALEGLTAGPAKILGMSNDLGEIKAGALANLIITSKSLFEEKSEINENWVRGKRLEVKPIVANDIRGEYQIKVGNDTWKLAIKGEPEKPKAQVFITDTIKVDAEVSGTYPVVSLVFATEKEAKSRMRLSGRFDGRNMAGEGQKTDGQWTNWSGIYTGEAKEEPKKEPAKK